MQILDKSHEELLGFIDQLHGKLDYSDYSRLHDIASVLISELEAGSAKSVAMKVIRPNDPKNWWMGHRCPSCKESITVNRKSDLTNGTCDKHCRNCGQKLDWSYC